MLLSGELPSCDLGHDLLDGGLGIVGHGFELLSQLGVGCQRHFAMEAVERVAGAPRFEGVFGDAPGPQAGQERFDGGR